MKKLLGIAILLIASSTAYATEYLCTECESSHLSVQTTCNLGNEKSSTCGRVEASLKWCTHNPECLLQILLLAAPKIESTKTRMSEQ